MRIGIYGGTFNPPHNGHLTAATAAAAQLKLDRLVLIPADIPPHKALPAESAGAEDRLEMTRLAAGYLHTVCPVDVLDWEINRGGTSYTSDTLRQMREHYPNDELWLLMGTDMFLSFLTWHEPETILSLAGIAAFGRERGDDLTGQKARLERDYGARIQLVDNPEIIELSSTEVRKALRTGDGSSLLPAAVYGYILRRGLYGTQTDLRCLTPDTLRPIALSYLKHKRMAHVLGTEEEAVRLARLYGEDETKARLAALLHDCTKKLDLPQQLALCDTYHIPLDEMERHALKLLHAKTGAAIAREVFGLSEEICSAIEWHTTGRANMSRLEKILYLADYIEPSREFRDEPDVAHLRQICYEDLDRGMLLGLEMVIQEMEGMGNPIHPHTVAARDWLMKEGVQP
jgi:nicotinate-nucleotide adenylyltransferase